MQPLANIHPDAKVADNVTIAPFVTIEKNTVIEEGTWIGANAVIMEGARIGKNCKIYPSAVISAVPQDLKYRGEITTAEIGDRTVIREFVTISRGTSDKHKTVIGSDCLIMAYVHIAHDCMVGDHCIIGNSAQIAGHCSISHHAVLGGTCAVHQFSKIGSHAMISGGSLVKKDVPPYTTAGREPLSYCGINSIGLRRRGFSNSKIQEIQEIYRMVYLSGMNNTQAVDKVQVEMEPTSERDEIIDFIRNSDRGIMKGFMS